MNLVEILKWRYATKRMNGTKVTDQKMHTILEAIRMAPSSFGLQPYHVFVVTDPMLKAKIKEVAWRQPQITEASHILIFAAWSSVSIAQIDKYINQVAHERNMSHDQLIGYKDKLLQFMGNFTSEQIVHWTSKQAYLGLGFGLIAAAEQQVDACPMEGFEPAKLDELLDLKSKHLKSTAIMAVGYRDIETDTYHGMAKVRRPFDDMFTFI
ncbi:MAG TPA: NAD(P)H-dependent oxidoreductase [Porphyromonadaceae bacterium]|nr:NAD(P)H-dependent oxidoreductase [Porphyromonadaceae bacterium]